MRRRTFVRRMGGAALGAGLIPAAGMPLVGAPGEGGVHLGGTTRPAESATPAPDGSSPTGDRGSSFHAPFRLWSWVHGGADRTPAQWRDEFARLREAGIGGVLVGGGDTGVLADAAHRQGLEFHRWIWVLNRNGDRWAQENHPEWFTVNRNGESSLESPPYVGYYRWVCPTRRPVRAYLREQVEAIAEDERVDGVHLDYIRHCDVILPRGLWSKYDLVQDTELPEFDYCYCDVCRPTFEALHGVDPLELAAPEASGAWERFRWDTVTEVVELLAQAVHARGKPITAAVFPTPSIARRLVRQAWDQWPLDGVFPMLYNGFYLEDIDWIGEGVRSGLAAGVGAAGVTVLDGEARPGVGESAVAPPDALYAGLYLPDLDREGLERAVTMAREAGAHGVSVFESNGLDAAMVAGLPRVGASGGGPGA